MPLPPCYCCQRRAVNKQIRSKLCQLAKKLRPEIEKKSPLWLEYKKKGKSAVTTYIMPTTEMNSVPEETSPPPAKSKSVLKRERQKRNKQLQLEKEKADELIRIENKVQEIAKQLHVESFETPGLLSLMPLLPIWYQQSRLPSTEPSLPPDVHPNVITFFKKKPTVSSSNPGPVQKLCQEKKKNVAFAASTPAPKKEAKPSTAVLSRETPVSRATKQPTSQKHWMIRQQNKQQKTEKNTENSTTTARAGDQESLKKEKQINSNRNQPKHNAPAVPSNGNIANGFPPTPPTAPPKSPALPNLTFSDAVKQPKKETTPPFECNRFKLPKGQETPPTMASLSHGDLPLPTPRMSPTNSVSNGQSAEKHDEAVFIPPVDEFMIPKPAHHCFPVAPLIPWQTFLGSEEKQRKVEDQLYQEYLQLIPGHEYLFPKKECPENLDEFEDMDYFNPLDPDFLNVWDILRLTGAFTDE